MKSMTDKKPSIPIEQFKRTKIVVTVGPATDTYEDVKALIEAGANVIRMNFSHGDHAEHMRRLGYARKASKACGKPVACIQDLQGPKIRLGDFDGVVNVQKGQTIRLKYGANYETEGILPVQYDISTKVKRGEKISLYDGRVRTTVTSIKDKVVYVNVENDGILIKRRGMNLPDTDFGGDILTEKDHKDIAFGSDKDFDYVAISFVQSASDITNLRKILNNLGSSAKIIAKIETKAAIKNLESIIAETDAVMVARGDLAYETEPEYVPVLQRKMVSLAIKYDRPVIVATQMMASMMESPEPTRAEVSDVATAVFIGADAVMLSDETTVGKYPIEAVQMMKRVIRYSEENAPTKAIYSNCLADAHTRQGAISDAIIGLADSLDATAIVTETKSGATAFTMAARRSSRPLIAVTSSARVAQQLALVYSVKSFVRKDEKLQAQKLTDWLKSHNVLKKGDTILTVSGQYPGVVGTTDTIKVRVIE